MNTVPSLPPLLHWLVLCQQTSKQLMGCNMDEGAQMTANRPLGKDRLHTITTINMNTRTVRGHHSPLPITPATADSPRYVPPHKQLNHRQLLET